MSKKSLTDKIDEKESSLPPSKRAERFLKRSKFLNDFPEDDEEPRDMAWGKTNKDGGFVPDEDDEK